MRAHTRGRQGGENRYRMNEALIQNAKHDVDRAERGGDQIGLVLQRSLKGLGRSAKSCLNGGGHAQFGLRVVDDVDRVAQCDARRQIEGNRHGGILALVVDGQRCDGGLVVRDGGQRNLAAGG